MIKNYLFFFTAFFTIAFAGAQNEKTNIIIDWKQHNLIKNNRNLFNPAYSFARQETRELSFWNRTQWVGIEDSPQTFLLNYSGRFGDNTGAGIGLYQQSQGLFVDSGIFLNYAYGLQIADDVWFTVGINGTGFRRGLNKTALNTPGQDPALLEYQDDFFMVLMPGANLTIGSFDVGFYAENFFDYNFSNEDKRSNYSEKIFSGQFAHNLNFDRGVGLLNDASLRSIIYGKKIPNRDFQYGVNFLFNLPDYGWIQAGYNETYGVAGGLGVKIFEGFNVGLLIETGTSDTSNAFGSTYEVTTTLELFRRNKRQATSKKKNPPKKISRKEEKNDRDKSLFEDYKEGGIIRKDTINGVQPTKKATAIKKNQTDSLRNVLKDGNPAIRKVLNEVHNNTIADTLNAQRVSEMNIQQLDSMNINKDTDVSILSQVFKENKPNSRYKAVERIDGVEYGFYLVANVYATKRYFNLFMKHMTNKGLEPKHFYNSDNKYFYVYLKKYDRLSDIEAARRNKYDNRYLGETWILWVRKN